MINNEIKDKMNLDFKQNDCRQNGFRKDGLRWNDCRQKPNTNDLRQYVLRWNALDELILDK